MLYEIVTKKIHLISNLVYHYVKNSHSQVYHQLFSVNLHFIEISLICMINSVNGLLKNKKNYLKRLIKREYYQKFKTNFFQKKNQKYLLVI